VSLRYLFMRETWTEMNKGRDFELFLLYRMSIRHLRGGVCWSLQVRLGSLFAFGYTALSYCHFPKYSVFEFLSEDAVLGLQVIHVMIRCSMLGGSAFVLQPEQTLP